MLFKTLIAVLPLLAGIQVNASPILIGRKGGNDTSVSMGEGGNSTSNSSSNNTSSEGGSSENSGGGGGGESGSNDSKGSESNSSSESSNSESGSGSGFSKNDETVILFALAAETLESNFYEVGLKTFSSDHFEQFGYRNGDAVIEQLTVIQEQESIHLSTLTSVAQEASIDISALGQCSFDFSSAMVSVQTFIETARIFELVGVGAYEGGALLVENQELLISALSIHAVEGVHSSMVNLLGASSPSSSPFAVPLEPQQVLGMLSPFVKGCDLGGLLGITPSTALTITNTETITVNTQLSFDMSIFQGQDTSKYFCNIISGSNTKGIVMPMSKCIIPEKIDGVVFASIVSSDVELDVNIVIQDETVIVAGPVPFVVYESVTIISEEIISSSSIFGFSASGSESSNSNSNSNSNSDISSISNSGSLNSGSLSSSISNILSNPLVSATSLIDGSDVNVPPEIAQLRQELGVVHPVSNGGAGAISLGWLGK
ncbi:hypothetical protein TREMEDRAFT_60887 [Tremella mesenterica DSM 1558]|uniref:uncharacterized protein n=1 Tax=Tremella mesenterica (strain ATCC 24925 / CBS 8224 / DSM 1558 / NBRC 9311 / NRRL Y-6157 / RJB 2259-6 / UBC 559-6) TaxID=578456 RepID=UPI0003F4A600|nr:uncharacterized protein TREMEDRAFT_60887 [Tremella mesenterica DSM 1558]EIW70390.1 hypothetical protein TREMEDRAFT_60887 [Tremella mesenterica DSM 1558]